MKKESWKGRDKCCCFASVENERNWWLIKAGSNQSGDIGYITLKYRGGRILAMISDSA